MDLALRSPLGLEDLPSEPHKHNKKLKHVLAGLLVGSQVLQLSVETQFTAACLLHRYYALRANNNHNNNNVDDKWICAVCLFLAAKVEEETRRLRDVINCAHMIDWTNSNDEDTPSATPTIRFDSKPMDLDENYWKAKRHIVKTEQHVLRWIGFDTSVSHPHRAIVLLTSDANLIVQAFAYLNNSMWSVQALKHSTLSLACAAVELAVVQESSEGKPRFLKAKWYSSHVAETEFQAALADLRQCSQL